MYYVSMCFLKPLWRIPFYVYMHFRQATRVTDDICVNCKNVLALVLVLRLSALALVSVLRVNALALALVLRFGVLVTSLTFSESKSLICSS